MRSTFTAIAVSALLLAVQLAEALEPAAQRTPSVRGLNQRQEAYQIGVWVFIVFLAIALIGFVGMANISIDDDAMLTSAPITDGEAQPGATHQ
jgi:hypothetical protein